jgi:predicted metal-dependent phosphotriesterase family hydrolase
VAAIPDLVSPGYALRIVFSHDVCGRGRLRSYGRNGYSYVLSSLAHTLPEAGTSHKDWTTMTVKNPARVLDIA